VSQFSRTIGVSRQTLYSWKAKGQAALQAALAPAKERTVLQTAQLERAILTLLLEGHASYRGIQRCLRSLLGVSVSLGTITTIVREAGVRAEQWINRHLPATARGLALDEMYGRQRGQAYRSRVDVGSGAVWACTSPVAVDGESWTLLLWDLQDHGLHWHTTVSDGGRAIGEAVSSVSPERPHHRDVWHVL
jgi:transposase-like protein